jgi:surface polysaccharide O-acyltransferase-like enzyme
MDFLIGASFGPYYYVFVIVVLVLMTPVFARLPQRALVALLVLVLASQVHAVLAAALSDAAGPDIFSSPWTLRHPRLWWMYFLLGWLARHHHEELSSWVVARRRRLSSVLALVVAGLALLVAFDLSPVATKLSAWLNISAILMLMFVLSCGLERVPKAIRLLSEATLSIYLLHLFFVYSAEDWFPHAGSEAEPVMVLVLWTARLVGSLLVIFVGRFILGRHSRAIIGA